jgi:mediator of RNA polymerase II transcription subunit 10
LRVLSRDCRNALVAELDTMQKLADGCNIQVPMEVVK